MQGLVEFEAAAGGSSCPRWGTHLVHVEGAEHLLDVLVGLWIQPSKPKELLKLMLCQLARGTLLHELLVPVVDLHGLQIIHRGAAVVPHADRAWEGCSGSAPLPPAAPAALPACSWPRSTLAAAQVRALTSHQPISNVNLLRGRLTNSSVYSSTNRALRLQKAVQDKPGDCYFGSQSREGE